MCVLQKSFSQPDPRIDEENQAENLMGDGSHQRLPRFGIFRTFYYQFRLLPTPLHLVSPIFQKTLRREQSILPFICLLDTRNRRNWTTEQSGQAQKNISFKSCVLEHPRNVRFWVINHFRGDWRHEAGGGRGLWNVNNVWNLELLNWVLLCIPLTALKLSSLKVTCGSAGSIQIIHCWIEKR